jgi:hypothetical protein
MVWTTPRTWIPGETVTASLLNTHVRDDFNVVKTQIDNDGSLRLGLKGFGFNAGQGNAAGSGNTQLTSFDTNVPAGYVSQPGDALCVEGDVTIANNANAKAFKIQVAGGTILTVWSGTDANTNLFFRLNVRRRNLSTAGVLDGLCWTYVDAGTPAFKPSPFNTLGTVDWTVAQTLKFFGVGVATNDVLMVELRVYSFRSVAGVVV